MPSSLQGYPKCAMMSLMMDSGVIFPLYRASGNGLLFRLDLVDTGWPRKTCRLTPPQAQVAHHEEALG